MIHSVYRFGLITFASSSSTSYSELVSCHAVSVNNSSSDGHKSKRVQYHYIELCLQLQDALKRPRVRCTNEDMAQKATRHVRPSDYIISILSNN